MKEGEVLRAQTQQSNQESGGGNTESSLFPKEKGGRYENDRGRLHEKLTICETGGENGAKGKGPCRSSSEGQVTVHELTEDALEKKKKAEKRRNHSKRGKPL